MVDRINTRIRGPIAAIKAWVFGHSYTARVTVTFALIAGLTAIVAMGVLSFVWEQHFQNYTHENIQALADRTASAIADKYEKSNGHALDIVNTTGKGTYPPLTMSDVSPASAAHTLNQTMGIQVVGINNTIVYDSTVVMTGSDALAPNKTQSLAPGSDATMAHADIMVNGTAIGRVNMWVYGSDVLLSKTDQEFRNRSYQAMAFAAVLSIVLASLLGFLFARSLVHPISRMTETAAAIKEGDLSARTNLEGDDEIAELGKTFDAMAASVEKDRELERRLTTDVAHELRTPLMAIQSTVEAIVDGVFEPDAERLGTIDAEVQRLSRMVDALLKLSRLENRTTPLNEEVVNVGEMIRLLAMSHEAYINEAGLQLVYEAEDDVVVYADRDLIRQATANLISNAVRYTPAPGTITVSVKKSDDEAMISVQDTGVGLTPEECTMVFGRFWRADSSRERASGGLGIGLSVVKEIVDRHHGWVDVQGAKGEGACFTLHIPLYDYERIKSMREKESIGAETLKGASRSSVEREGLIG
ncbi:sensor histidine kinase [Slackia exigua]|uniref:sensor histidine kinase n=1 Tax=Slackia exigua TaxID=84109 RepID=UPI0020055019|nr:HAMP domain-containing sensor histidine kinase [Slackia exigua]MCK6138493.1 HAMP domain-containing histidine kinase [Slackia exigua]